MFAFITSLYQFPTVAPLHIYLPLSLSLLERERDNVMERQREIEKRIVYSAEGEKYVVEKRERETKMEERERLTSMTIKDAKERDWFTNTWSFINQARQRKVRIFHVLSPSL